MDKDKTITFRAVKCDIDRWRKAAEGAGLTMSDICRAALEEHAKSVGLGGGSPQDETK